MAKREIATKLVRVYPSTQRTLRRLAVKNHMTMAGVIEALSRFGLTN